ncbi:hypothetical protein, partial [Peribacillus frigoritolerans]|nr:hypothetical protein [Peribacillus frigoritolerans]
MKKKSNKKDQPVPATQDVTEGKNVKEKKGPKDGTASTESVQTEELSEPKGHKGPHEGGDSAGAGDGKHGKGA